MSALPAEWLSESINQDFGEREGEPVKHKMVNQQKKFERALAMLDQLVPETETPKVDPTLVAILRKAAPWASEYKIADSVVRIKTAAQFSAALMPAPERYRVIPKGLSKTKLRQFEKEAADVSLLQTYDAGVDLAEVLVQCVADHIELWAQPTAPRRRRITTT